jgi:hypothetical protein
VRTIIWLHVAGGGIGLVSGFIALYTVKGSPRHRAIGRVFVYSMLAMALSGAGIAAATGVEASVAMGALAAYLVFTGMTTVKPPVAHSRPIALAGAGMACTIAVALADLGRRALTTPDQTIDGLPAVMAFVFAGVGMSASVSDVRMLMNPSPRPAPRVIRHLWRMCFALFIAAASFFLGQPQAIPRALRNPWLLAVPVLTPLLAMAYWFCRMRIPRVASMCAPPSADAA